MEDTGPPGHEPLRPEAKGARAVGGAQGDLAEFLKHQPIERFKVNVTGDPIGLTPRPDQFETNLSIRRLVIALLGRRAGELFAMRMARIDLYQLDPTIILSVSRGLSSDWQRQCFLSCVVFLQPPYGRLYSSLFDNQCATSTPTSTRTAASKID